MNHGGIGNAPDAGLRALWGSVLYQAVMDWIGVSDLESKTEKTVAMKSAGAWFYSDLFEPSSFLWVCSWLQIDPVVIRAQLNSRHLLLESVVRQCRMFEKKGRV